MCTGVKNLNYCTHTTYTYTYSTHISDIVLMMEEVLKQNLQIKIKIKFTKLNLVGSNGLS